jgi:hypothetical protein
MSLNRLRVPILIFVFLVFGWYAASAFMVAKAISPPDARSSTILRSAIHPRFQMATPHRNLFKEIKVMFFPSAQACSGTCNGNEAKPKCYVPPCANDGNCYQCPSCTLQGGCTTYVCTYVGHRTLCVAGWNTSPCQLCELDHNATCQP